MKANEKPAMTIEKALSIWERNKQGKSDWTIEEGQQAMVIVRQLKDAGPDMFAALKLLLYGAEQAQKAGVVQPQLNGGVVLAKAVMKKLGVEP